MKNDLFKVFDGDNLAAESLYYSFALEEANRIAFHGGSPKILRRYSATNMEREVASSAINPESHVCTAYCKPNVD